MSMCDVIDINFLRAFISLSLLYIDTVNSFSRTVE